MSKVVINKCYGGFSVSDAAMHAYAERKGLALYPEVGSGPFKFVTYWTVPPEQRPPSLEGEAFYKASLAERQAYNAAHSANTIGIRDFERDDPDLVAVVEALGEQANGAYANLEIVEVPYGVEWEIAEYDGQEWVSEKHRTWG